jgi:hypothetical protein
MPKYEAAWGKEDMVDKLEELLARAERGEDFCAALRLYKPDGTWEDVAIGGTEEQQAQALADLRAAKDKAN